MIGEQFPAPTINPFNDLSVAGWISSEAQHNAKVPPRYLKGNLPIGQNT
jgi:hypothetical protein